MSVDRELLEVESLTKRFGARELWRDISFTVEPGQIVALTGPSGCGKTTLLNCLGMLESASSGRIRFGGRGLTDASRRRRKRHWRNEVGFLFQDFALIESLNVISNVNVVAPHVLARGTLRAASERALESVGLGSRGKEPTYQLSGGEQQRVALARMIVKSPKLILADEPTGSLDAANEQMVLSSLRTLANEGKMVVLATHSQEVMAFSDGVIVLQGH